MWDKCDRSQEKRVKCWDKDAWTCRACQMAYEHDKDLLIDLCPFDELECDEERRAECKETWCKGSAMYDGETK